VTGKSFKKNATRIKFGISFNRAVSGSYREPFITSKPRPGKMKRHFHSELGPCRTLVWVELNTSTQTHQCQQDLSFRHPLYAAF